ncbi:MAG: LacI family transcriptional regulator [Actinobacteria bacterium]|nr:LacI family transcriptional regulator [Actinomycetota bacterium]
MRDVANMAGVSLKTVSRAINGEPHLSPATLERVLAAVEELGFRRNDMARDLRSGGASATIGLVIEDVSNPFYSVVMRAVEEVARERNVLVIAGSSEEDADVERELVGSLCGRRVDGLLIVPAGRDHRYLLPEMAMGTAVVFLDRPPAGVKADTVVVDNVGGAEQGVAHLLAAGHRRIGFIGDRPDIYTVRERLKGFRRGIERVGGAVDERYIRLDVHTPDAAERAAAELLGLAKPPTALFLVNNRTTVGVVRLLAHHPAPVDIVGFDDFELADLLPFPITLIAHDVAELGRLGAQLLFDRLDGKTYPVRKVVVPTTLVQRGLRAPVGSALS